MNGAVDSMVLSTTVCKERGDLLNDEIVFFKNLKDNCDCVLNNFQKNKIISILQQSAYIVASLLS